MQNEVLVAILTRDMVPTPWAIALRKLRLPESSKIVLFSGLPFDHARNAACQQALTEQYQRLFFLDDDVIVPEDAYERLKSRAGDIVGGLYYRRKPPVEPVMMKRINGQVFRVSEFRSGELVDCDMTGAGCLLIHRRVLESMEKPWFEWLRDREDLPLQEQMSEDFAFCWKARQAGFSVRVDTNVRCAHAGYGQSMSDGKFLPLET